MVLPCGHSFCFECVQQIIHRGSRKLRCPTCREGAQAKQVVDNYALRQIIEDTLVAEAPCLSVVPSAKTSIAIPWLEQHDAILSQWLLARHRNEAAAGPSTVQEVDQQESGVHAALDNHPTPDERAPANSRMQVWRRALDAIGDGQGPSACQPMRRSRSKSYLRQSAVNLMPLLVSQQ